MIIDQPLSVLYLHDNIGLNITLHALVFVCGAVYWNDATWGGFNFPHSILASVYCPKGNSCLEITSFV